jgi:hypothetical protein
VRWAATAEDTACVVADISVSVPTGLDIPDVVGGECSDEMRRYLACSCGQKESAPLTAAEVASAGSRLEALNRLCTDPLSGEVAFGTSLLFEASVRPFLSTSAYVSDALEECTTPWEPRDTLKCWEDVEEMRWRARDDTGNRIDTARLRWQTPARAQAHWAFSDGRYPGLDSEDFARQRPWIDRVGEQGE